MLLKFYNKNVPIKIGVITCIVIFIGMLFLKVSFKKHPIRLVEYILYSVSMYIVTRCLMISKIV
jgi:hypothetical protein